LAQAAPYLLRFFSSDDHLKRSGHNLRRTEWNCSVKIEEINPLMRAADIKALFLRNSRSEFPAWFDRAYHISVEKGGKSWIMLSDGVIVGHLAAHPSRFTLGEIPVRGALLSNLLVDPAFRTFFPVVKLIREAVRALKHDGIDFVYSDPDTEEAAAVCQAAGMKQSGTLNRFIFAFGANNPLLSIPMRTYAGLRRFRHGGIQARVINVRDAAARTLTVSPMSDLSPTRHDKLYSMRLGTLDAKDFLGFQLLNKAGGQVGVALLRLNGNAATVVSLRCEGLASVPSSVAALGTALQRMDVIRMSIRVIQNTPYAAALVRGGFIRRNDPRFVMTSGLSDTGRAAATAMGVSAVEKIDMD
jgi:hypothetical protein